MKKKLLYTVLSLMGIMGTLSMGLVSAEVTYSYNPNANISYTLNSGFDTKHEFTAGTITITSGSESITILDRNLGAIATGYCNNSSICGTASGYETLGYYFQRGNNYGFATTGAVNSGSMDIDNVDVTGYEPSTYSSDKFLTNNATPNNWAKKDNGNLRGGVGDTTEMIKVTNPGERRGPCPVGWHVPSYSEWKTLLNRINNRDNFLQKLYIPYAGYRSYTDASPYIGKNIGGQKVKLWSSSPYTSYSYIISVEHNGFSLTDITVSNTCRAFGLPVRCFSDSSSTVVPQTLILTFTGSEGGSISTGSIEAIPGSSISLDNGAGTVTISGTVVATGIANEGYVFSGWLTDCGDTVTKACNFTGEFKPITYTVEFTGTDVSGTMVNQNFEYDSGQALTANAFTKTGYTFSGWTDGTTGYANNQNVSNLTTTDGAKVVLTAQWTPITYTISFTGNSENVTGTAPATKNAEYDSGDIAPDNTFTMTGYTFTGWNTESDGTGTGYASGAELKNLTTTSGAEVKLYAQWEVNKHKLNFVVDGTNIQSGDVAYSSGISAFLPSEPKKDCNNFAGWTSNVAGLTTTGTMPDSDVTFSANWNYTCSRSSGGGGSSRSSTANTQDSSEKTQNDKNTENVIQSETKGSEESSNTPMDSSANASEGQYSEEFQRAYEFAFKNGITTMDTIEKANMDKPLTRIAMAKMLSYYAINVLKKEPDLNRVNKFKDISDELDAQYDNGVTLAYQLGIMGINMPNNKFRPNDYVTRAEFGTALSRLLFGTEDGKDVYYSTHLAKLMEEKIITNNNPNLQELRGYVMIMLMRSAE